MNTQTTTQTFTILVSHHLYGSCYITTGGELTKDRAQAKTYKTHDEVQNLLASCEKEYKCQCYVSTIINGKN